MKRTHTNILIGLITCGAIVAVSVALLTATGSRVGEPPASTPELGRLPPPDPTPTPRHLVPSAAIPSKNIDKDQEIEAFTSRSSNDQLHELSPLAAITDLPDERKARLSSLLRDKRLDPSVRNVIANVLANQQDIDRSLWRSFAAMASDAGEEYQWREYAVQHLADSLRYSREIGEISQVLWKFVEKGEKGIPGTALLLMCRLNKEGLTSVPETLPDLLGRLIQDSSRDVSVRMTALSIVGERREVRCRPKVLAIVAEQPALRRVALATLGLLGDERDRVIVAGYLNDQDTLVAAAARGALERLSIAQSDPSTQTPQSF